MSALAALTVAVPLGAGTVLAILGPWLGRRAIDALALLATLATLALCVIVTVRVGTGLTVHWFGGWEPREHLAIGIDLAVDAFGAGIAAFVSLLTALAFVLTRRSIGSDHPRFQVLMLIFLGAMVGFAESGDLFNVFVFFELMSVAALALVGYLSEERPALQGALNFGVVNTLGSFLFLVGIALVYSRAQTLNLAGIGRALEGGPPDAAVLVGFALVAVALLVKAGVVPFHFWLADAYAVAPAAVCLLLAGAMSEMGLFGVGRVWFTAFAGPLHGSTETVRTLLLVLGATTAVWGAGMALAEDHLKRLLAFVTMSFVGVYLCGLALLTADAVGGTALYVLADGLGKAGLFACAGIVQHRRGTVSIRRLHGAGRDLRATGALWLGLALCLAAFPLTGGFLAKGVIDDAAIKDGFGWLPALLMLVAAVNAGAVLAAGARIFRGWGERRRDEGQPGQADEPPREDPGTPASMWVPAALLLAGAVVSGWWFGAADRLTAAAERFADGTAYAARVLDGTTPPAIVAGSAAPAWYDWLYGAGATALALAVAALSLWGARRAVTARAGALGSRLAHPVRALHSGHVGDYVAWFALGAGAIAVTLAAAA